MKKLLVQWLCAMNDADANPRRLYVFYRLPADPESPFVGAKVAFVFDEGYRGKPWTARDGRLTWEHDGETYLLIKLPWAEITNEHYAELLAKAEVSGISV